MRIAYADPPYPGTAKMYGCEEVDHQRLLLDLYRFDGWALSTSVNALEMVLKLSPSGTRIAAFVKPNRSFPTTNVSTWEPVLYKQARPNFTKDHIFCRRVWRGQIEDCDTSRFGRGLNCRRPSGKGWGVKPPEFCGWLFEILGCEPDDEFHDLFYGSGAVTRAWNQWRQIKTAGGPLFVKKEQGDG